MRKLRIVTDSSSDIQALQYADFAYSPMKLIAGEREFVDGESLNVDEMVDFFGQYKGISRSSCPNVADWLEAFGEADDILCVTITSALSGSYNTACAAKSVYEAENEGKRVFVLDTLSTGPESLLIIQKLEEYARSGMPYEEICEQITQYRQKTGLVFMLKSLRNLSNNGRVSPLIARIVKMAGICLVGKASDEGTLDILHKCRGEARSLKLVEEVLEELGMKEGRVSIGHCQNEPAALRLKDMIQKKFRKAEIEIYSLRGLCSFYAEKGGLLVGFEKI